MTDISKLWSDVKHAALRYSMGTNSPVTELAHAYQHYLDKLVQENPKAGEISVMILGETAAISVKRKDLPRFMVAHPETARELIKAWVT